MLARQFNHGLGGMAAGHGKIPHGILRGDPSQAVISMHVAGASDPAAQRARVPFMYGWNGSWADGLHDPQGVGSAGGQRHVAGNHGDRPHIQRWRAQG